MEFNGYLYSGSDNRTIIKWNNDGTVNQILKGHSSSVLSLVEFDGYLYSGSYDKTIIKWNKDGTISQTLKGHSGLITSLVEFNGDLYSTDTKTIIKWNKDGTIKEILKGSNDVRCLIVFNGHLYSGSFDGRIIKWGEFTLQHYRDLNEEKQTLLWEASKIFYMYGICKDVRLLIFRYLII